MTAVCSSRAPLRVGDPFERLDRLVLGVAYGFAVDRARDAVFGDDAVADRRTVDEEVGDDEALPGDAAIPVEELREPRLDGDEALECLGEFAASCVRLPQQPFEVDWSRRLCVGGEPRDADADGEQRTHHRRVFELYLKSDGGRSCSTTEDWLSGRRSRSTDSRLRTTARWSLL